MIKPIALLLSAALLWAAPVQAAQPADARRPAPPADAALTQGWPEAKLMASAPAHSARFGLAVALEGGLAVIGAPRDTAQGVTAGAAYLFRFDGMKWVQTARLAASDGAAGDLFGQAVAIDGDAIVVGAPGDDEAGGNSGAAYVFRSTSAGWVQEAKLLPNSPNDMSFGFTVAVDGKTIAVGGPYSFAEGTATNSGTAYIFQRSGGRWAQVIKLASRTGGAALSDLFGWAVALNGDTLVVGAYLGEAAHVFQRYGSTWNRVARLTGSDTQRGDRFGYSVAVDGDTLVVGAAQDDAGGHNSGSAYVFRSTGGAWSEQAKLAPAGAMTGSRFGWSVAIQGGTLIVGARESEGHQDRTEAGAAYVYRNDGGAWSLARALVAGDAASQDHFGAAVAIDSGVALIGTPDGDSGGPEAGAAYVYPGLAPGDDSADRGRHRFVVTTRRR